MFAFEADMMMTVRFSRDDEEDDLDAERVVFAPLKRALQRLLLLLLMVVILVYE